MNCELPFICAVVFVLSAIVISASFKLIAKVCSKVGTLWIAGAVIALVMLASGVWYGAHIKSAQVKAVSSVP